MSTSRKPLRALAALLVAAALAGPSFAADRFDGIGRAATPAEVKAWDIDVRPDFKGLPPGQGSVEQGQALWEAQCAGCHGVFGESNEVFTPLVGGTTKEDIARGRVARLADPAFPQRTTMMKLSSLATLWDYIHRAMPWTAPKSLKPDEVYAVTAYLLNLADVVPADFTLSDRNIREVQAKLPNRDGMTTAHGLWPGKAFGDAGPDVQGKSCLQDCVAEVKIDSSLPDFARSAHGNLAQQQRLVGPQRGAETAPPRTAREASPAQAPVASLLQANACVACHQIDSRAVGPALREVAAKYQGRSDAAEYLAGKIKSGGSGVWGAVPMPAQPIAPADAERIAQWLAGGAKP